MKLLVLITAGVVLAGCVPLKSGHVLVIGFGVVSTSHSNEMASVTRTSALGLVASDLPGTKLAVGYASSMVISVKTNSNLLIEVTQAPLSPITIAVPPR